MNRKHWVIAVALIASVAISAFAAAVAGGTPPPWSQGDPPVVTKGDGLDPNVPRPGKPDRGKDLFHGKTKPDGSQEVTPYASDNYQQGDDVFGCLEVDTYSPGFVFQGVIEGVEDLQNCTGLASTTVNICLESGSNFACSTDNHAGNGAWTATTNAYACQGTTTRSIRTVAWAITYRSLKGHTAVAAHTSNFENMNCG